MLSGDMKSKFIETALELINIEGSTSSVNLRTIARKIGCSHQNLYNYFKNYDELLWECMIPSLEKLTEYTWNVIEDIDDKDSKVRAFFESQIVFAVENPGIYSLIWLEKLNGEPPDYIRQNLDFASKQFIRIVGDFAECNYSSEQLLKLSDILHNFIHGSICKVIRKRIDENVDEFIAETVENCIDIMKFYENTIKK